MKRPYQAGDKVRFKEHGLVWPSYADVIFTVIEVVYKQSFIIPNTDLIYIWNSNLSEHWFAVSEDFIELEKTDKIK